MIKDCTDKISRALSGLRHCVAGNGPLRLHLLLACLFIPIAVVVDATMMQHVMLIFSVVFVLVVGLLNAGAHYIVDRMAFDRVAMGQDIKNIGTAACLIALLFAIFAWTSIFFLWK